MFWWILEECFVESLVEPLEGFLQESVEEFLVEFQWKPLATSLEKFWIESLYEFMDFLKASLDLDF